MAFDPHIAVIRFGMGLSPLHAVPTSADDLLDEVAGQTIWRWPIQSRHLPR